MLRTPADRRMTATLLGLAALGAVSSLGRLAPAYAQKQNLAEFAQPAIRDISATVDVASRSDKELDKIGKGYTELYAMSKRELWCKEPGMVRFQGKKGLFTIRTITAGKRRATQVPTLRINKVEDLSKEPGKGDSIVDLGLITPAWVELVEDRWLRTETRNGKQLQVFEFWYKEDPKFKNTIWVDPGTKNIVEHISHHRNPNRPGFKKRFVYGDFKQVSGIWVPGKVELYNGENKLAATAVYGSLKVNSGLSDSLFTF